MVFNQMIAEAKQIETDGVVTRVVSLPHLFALKCHAFTNRPHRALKDIEDLVQLTRLNKLDLNEPSLRAILLKHGGLEFYELLKRERDALRPE
jgi:predicted nucleotidyltransferase